MNDQKAVQETQNHWFVVTQGKLASKESCTSNSGEWVFSKFNIWKDCSVLASSIIYPEKYGNQ